MNLRQIEAFKAFMETGTVTQAAARIQVSQPAASKLLQLFERRSGLVLFTRHKGRLLATPEARLLFEEVDRVFEGIERVRVAAREIRSLERGILSVGVMPALSVGFAQEVIARLRATQPGLCVTIQVRESAKLLEQLVTQRIELLYTSMPFDHPEIRNEMLCRVKLVCILPPQHRLAQRRRIECRDLADEPFASFQHDSVTRRQVDQAFEDSRVARRIALETPVAPAICAFVARGLGVAIVNPLFVGALSSALVVRPFAPAIESTVYVASPRARRLSMLADSFAQASRALAREIQGATGTTAPRPR